MAKRTVSVLAAALAVGLVASAQDESSAEGEKPVVPEGVKSAETVRTFTALPFCQLADGVAEVMIPGSKTWVRAAEGKFYPLGTSYRTAGGDAKLVVAFGSEAKVSIEGDSSFGTRPQALGGASRTVVVGGGSLKLDLARNLPEGAFVVVANGFTVKNPAGESKFVVTPKPDGVESVVRCVTGTLSIEGRHYEIPQMRAADEIRIRNTVDELETLLYGTSGDYVVKVDRGVVSAPKVDDEGKVTTVAEKSVLDWHLSPKTKVRISRLVPAIGKRLSVAVMTFDETGAMKNNFAYSEGRAEVNTGELLPQPVEDEEKSSAKKAAADAEETSTSAPEEDEKEDSENNKKEKEEE